MVVRTQSVDAGSTGAAGRAAEPPENAQLKKRARARGRIGLVPERGGIL